MIGKYNAFCSKTKFLIRNSVDRCMYTYLSFIYKYVLNNDRNVLLVVHLLKFENPSYKPNSKYICILPLHVEYQMNFEGKAKGKRNNKLYIHFVFLICIYKIVSLL